MKFEVILVLLFVGSTLLILIANDWWKKRLVRKYERKGKKVDPGWYINKTEWAVVAAVVIATGVYAFLLANPELANRDFGPLNPIIEWLFRDPPKPRI